MNCPTCKSRIPNENLNIASDIAQCPACDLVFKISEHVGGGKSASEKESEVDPNFNISDPPKGAWINQDQGELVLGVSTRSPIAFFLVPFMLVWSGGSLGGIYGSQIAAGEFDLFMSLFGIPFLLGSVIFWAVALMAIWGKVEITLDHSDGKVFTGLGKIGMTKHFSLNEITAVKENEVRGSKGSISYNIALEGKDRITFGTGLNDSKRYYLFNAMKKILHDKKHNKNFLKQDLSKHLIQR